MDINGRIAAATSTGGITGKRVGRVGDSPLIGITHLSKKRSSKYQRSFKRGLLVISRKRNVL